MQFNKIATSAPQSWASEGGSFINSTTSEIATGCTKDHSNSEPCEPTEGIDVNAKCPGCDTVFVVSEYLGPPFASSCCTFCSESPRAMLSCPTCHTVYCKSCIFGFEVIVKRKRARRNSISEF